MNRNETTTHPLNRHIFIADNLDLLKSLDNETIDLVCCDPPFAKNQTFKGDIKPPLTEAEIDAEKALLKEWGLSSREEVENAGLMWAYDDEASEAKFSDIWRYDKIVHEDWIMQLEDDWQPVSQAIKTSLQCNGENMAAYLTYMAVRLIEIERVLKPTGSFFLHCDQTASHYLKIILDAIFGAKQFRNEIAWCYPPGGAGPKQAFHRKHDVILFYSAGDNFFSRPYKPLTKKQESKFSKRTEDGRRYKEFKSGSETYKTFLDEHKGSPVPSWWSDIPSLGQTMSSETTGYPTQKPVALAERIIKTATNEGDVVLDPFAGCAYVPVAAEKNKRQWIACDISIRALTVLKRQFQKFDYSVDGETAEDKIGIRIAETFTRSPFQMPERTDEDPTEIPEIPSLPAKPFKVPASDIPEPEMKRLLLELSDYQAWCCGFANRMPKGEIKKTTANFHLDHIDPKSQRGSNQIMFRAPLCPEHNQKKKDRRISLEELRDEIEASDGFYVESRADLIDIAEARERAIDIHTDYMLKKNPHSQPLPISET